MDQPYHPGSSEYLKLLGYKRYHYLAWPQVSSTRLVLLHGRGESADIWTGFANQFTRCADTIALDLRGHGGTPWDPEFEYGFDDFVDDLYLQLKHWNRKSTLVGHGLGGRIAIGAAVRLPELVEGLVLIDTNIECEIPGSLIAKLADKSTISVLNRWTPSNRLDRENLYKSLTWARPGGDRSPKCDPAALEPIESSPLWEQTEALTQPTLLLSGGAGHTASIDVARIRAIPHVECDRVNGGDWPHIENPVGVAEVTRRFIMEIRPRP
jgi:pimeloyl-ACP methyl ester carboxylesterase